MSGEKAENKDFFEIKAENKLAIMNFVKEIANSNLKWDNSFIDINEAIDPIFSELMKKLDLSLWKGLKVSEIETKINQVIKEKKEIDKFLRWEKARISLEASQSIIDNFNLDSDIKDKTKVIALQRVLKTKWYNLKWKNDWVDWLFWVSTKKAYEKALSELKKDIVKKSISNAWVAEKNIRHKDKQSVEDKIGFYNQSLDETSKLLDVSKDVQDTISKIAEGEAEWYSLWYLVKEAFWENDKVIKFANQAKENSELIEQNQDKLERALYTLDIYEYSETDYNFEDDEYSKTLDFIWKTIPWVLWIYVMDLPIPFTSQIIPNLDLNKSMALNNWVKWWMKGEFTYNPEKDNYLRNAVEKAWDLRWTISTFLWDKSTQKLLSKDISELTKKEKDLISKFFENVMYPQMEYIDNNVFSGGLWNFIMDHLFSSDASKADKKMWELLTVIKEKDLDKSFKYAKEYMELVVEDVKEDSYLLPVDKTLSDAIESTDNKINFFEEIYKNNKVLESVAKLLEIWQNNISILYKFENKDDFIKAFGLQDFKETIDKVHEALENWDIQAIKDLKDSEKKLFSVIWTDKLWDFKITQLKTIELIEYVDRWKHKHWVDLRGLDRDKAYNELSKKWVEKVWENTLNSIQTLFKWLVYNAWIDNIWFGEFDNAMKNLITVPIHEMNWKVINTSRPENSKSTLNTSNLTSFSEWLWKEDKTIKHTSIDKDYTYYEWWNKVTETIKYNIYLRPECANLLIVPESIDAKLKKESAPKLDNRMYSERPRTIPLIIPYSVFEVSGDKKSAEVSTDPHVDWNWSTITNWTANGGTTIETFTWWTWFTPDSSILWSSKPVPTVSPTDIVTKSASWGVLQNILKEWQSNSPLKEWPSNDEVFNIHDYED